MDCIVIKKGKYFHYSYASAKWGQWGDPTGYVIFTCDHWQEGFEKVRQAGKKLALFIDSGTVFNDIRDFVEKLKNYPHQGLVGHIIDPMDAEKFYSLHPQCFLMDVDKFQPDVFVNDEFSAPATQRSQQNIHDDYTPLWLKPAAGDKKSMIQTEFGQKIIAQQISSNGIVSNWHQKLRDNKVFLYRNEIRKTWIDSQQPYLDLAEKHLWILNNQPVKLIDAEHLVSPASGLFWMLGTTPTQIDLVDISQSQLDLARDLVNNWHGIDYGSFVYDFIVSNRIRHIQLDVALPDTDKIKLISNKNNFCQYVNDRFYKQLNDFGITVDGFVKHWQHISHKKISYHRNNMVDWLLTAELSAQSGVWLSNIMDYKYTWIKSTESDIQQCQERLSRTGCKVEK